MDSNYSLNDYHEQNSSLKVLLLSENCNSPIHKKLKKKLKKKRSTKGQTSNRWYEKTLATNIYSFYE